MHTEYAKTRDGKGEGCTLMPQVKSAPYSQRLFRKPLHRREGEAAG